ncbi:MAG: hypothetical protein GX020_08655 [Firmicutes bacterium]|nr:hypothetical protein [Bacillota bacterium]
MVRCIEQDIIPIEDAIKSFLTVIFGVIPSDSYSMENVSAIILQFE